MSYFFEKNGPKIKKIEKLYTYWPLRMLHKHMVLFSLLEKFLSEHSFLIHKANGVNHSLFKCRYL